MKRLLWLWLLLAVAVIYGCSAEVGGSVNNVNTGNPDSSGHQSIGDDEIDLSKVVWLHASPEDFKITASLSNVRVSTGTNGSTVVSWEWNHPDWPAVLNNEVVGNMWVFANIKGTWYAATWEWLRTDTSQVATEAKSGEPPFIQAKASPISEWYPSNGEDVGWMVSTPCRGGYAGTLKERSPIVITTW